MEKQYDGTRNEGENVRSNDKLSPNKVPIIFTAPVDYSPKIECRGTKQKGDSITNKTSRLFSPSLASTNPSDNPLYIIKSSLPLIESSLPLITPANIAGSGR